MELKAIISPETMVGLREPQRQGSRSLILEKRPFLRAVNVVGRATACASVDCQEMTGAGMHLVGHHAPYL